jgi:hypothetical protein
MKVAPCPSPTGTSRELVWTAIYTQRESSYFEQKFGVVFEMKYYEGLGQFEEAGVTIGGTVCVLIRNVDSKAHKVVLDIPTGVDDPKEFVQQAVAALGLTEDSSVTLEESFWRLDWELLHQHTNGSTTRIARFSSEEGAKYFATYFESQRDGQHFFVQHAL